MLKSLQKPQPQSQSVFRIEIKKRYGSLESTNARLQVSVGGPRFEGDRFRALADFCRRRHSETAVIVSDTLQRHNWIGENDMRWAAKAEGDAWIERNAAALEGFKIVRWDDFIDHPEFEKNYQDIVKLTENVSARAAINTISFEFNKRRGVPIQQCRDFLLEELTVFSMMFKEPAIDIYPGAWITPLISATPHPSFAPNQIRCISVEPVHMKTDIGNKSQTSFSPAVLP